MSKLVTRIRMLLHRSAFKSEIIRKHYPEILERRREFLELARDS